MNNKSLFKGGLLFIALIIMLSASSVTAQSPETTYQTLGSFEQLLRDQHNLLVSLDDLMGQTPVTKEEKIEFLYSIEDLYRRQAMGMDKFSAWIDENWKDLTPEEKARVTDSFEDLLRRQAKNIESYNGNLLAWVVTFDQPYRQKFSDSLEDLLHRQVALLEKFETKLHQDGMQTPGFLSSFEDLLRRQANSLMGFGDLGELIFNNTTQEGPGIAIYKTADKTSLACGDDVTYKYTVYNNGDEDLSNIIVTDSDYTGNIASLPVYQSRSLENTVTTECSPDETYPIYVCNTATATGTDSSSHTVQATSNEVCIILNGPRQPTPEFVLEKTVEPTVASPGEQLVYTYTITNNGLLPITSIDIVDDKLGEVTTDQELQPGESKQYTKTATMGDSDITNIATATGIEGIGDVQSKGPKSQIVMATATATVNIRECVERDDAVNEGPASFAGTLEISEDRSCYLFTPFDNTSRHISLEKGDNIDQDTWNSLASGCFDVAGCLYSTSDPDACGDYEQLYVSSYSETLCPPPSCEPIDAVNGTGMVLRGYISTFAVGCPPILTTDVEGTVYELYDGGNETSWQDIQDIIGNGGGCAEVSGCAYEGLTTECNEGIPLYVTAISAFDCSGLSCPIIQGKAGHKVTAQGTISRCADGGGLILSADDGQGYNLFESDNEDAWAKVQEIYSNKGCAKVSGCVYFGLPTTCMAANLSIFVDSCEQIDCPGCPNITVDRQTYEGQEVTLTGNITETEGGCYVLTETNGNKHELEEDESDPIAWQEVLLLATGECADITGCSYDGMPPTCQGDGAPLYVRSCDPCTQPSELSCPVRLNDQTNEYISGILATKIGPLGDPVDSCPYILYYSYQNNYNGLTETKKYSLIADEQNPDAYNELVTNNAGKDTYVKVDGCIYEGLGSPCNGVPDAIPMYVRSVTVYPPCGESQVPFIDRGTIVQDPSTGSILFSSATGHDKFELVQDIGQNDSLNTSYSEAWNTVDMLKDTSKLVEIYGCEDTYTGPQPIYPKLHVRAAVEPVGAWVINPQNTTKEATNTIKGCAVCKG
jgi:hypothetical protein